MIEPITLDFEVRCSVDHAFDTWTGNIARWWPSDHTVGGSRGLRVVMEPGIGGRIYERHGDGREVDWGIVTTWQRPTQLGYTWHLGRTPADATDVLIRFVPLDAEHTRVEIEHRGWERLGTDGQAWRDRNGGGWESLLPHYRGYVDGSSGDPASTEVS